MRTDNSVEGAFGALAATLDDNLNSGTDLGYSIAVRQHGAPLIEWTDGCEDRAKETPLDAGRVHCIYSAGKAVVAGLIMAAVDAGALTYEQRVSDLWPAFGAQGKDQITVAQAMSHQAGLSGFVDPVPASIWLDHDASASAVAAAAPLFVPGSSSGYHPQTFGVIAGEIYRRATGKTMGAVIRTLGLSLHCGMTAVEQTRVGKMQKPPRAPDLGPLTPIKEAAFLKPWSAANQKAAPEDWMAAEIPASNMHADAAGLAAFMDLFAVGQIGDALTVSDATRAAAMVEYCHGDDLVLPFYLSWGAGVMRNVDGRFGPSASAVGHYGFGGAFGIADPETGVSAAYVPNKMTADLVAGTRATTLVGKIFEGVRAL